MQLKDDAEKRERLVRMRRVATGMLGAAGVVFIVARIYEDQFPWVGFVRAAAEAAMVGGVADWFAVTALFRHPLGIPIPHTAIVPARKDRIGASLGRFVEHNFLSREVLSAKVRSMHVAERLAEWLQRPESARRLAGHVTAAVGVMVDSLDDREVVRLIERRLVERLAETEATPIVADGLELFLDDQRRSELFDGMIRLIDRLVEENRDDLRARIAREVPWWLPAPIDEKIYEKVIGATEGVLQEVRMEPQHPLRGRFDDLIGTAVEKLRSSPELIERGERMKRELLDSGLPHDLASRVWQDLKHTLAPDESGRSELSIPLERAIARFGESLLEDAEMLSRVNRWAEQGVVAAAEEYRHEVAALISQTVERWDPTDTSDKIELQVGRDLQFIRINGTLVGGLVGLVLHTLVVLF